MLYILLFGIIIQGLLCFLIYWLPRTNSMLLSCAQQRVCCLLLGVSSLCLIVFGYVERDILLVVGQLLVVWIQLHFVRAKGSSGTPS